MNLAILVIEDDLALNIALKDVLEHSGHKVTAVPAAESGLEAIENNKFDVIITDVQLPGKSGYELLKIVKRRFPEVPVLIITAYGTIKSAVDSMRIGASDYLVKPFPLDLLTSKIQKIFSHRTECVNEFVSEDKNMRIIIDLAAQVAHTDATVMIGGESGTGKEVLSKFIHRLSMRSSKPFVAINCAAIPESMLEAVLFGYEKGSFTGALKSTPGKFEQAQEGTLLLDEISEMNINLQSKLLRIIQEKEVERLGGQTMIPLDVRLIATTNRNLREEVKKGNFREDLFFRLNVFPINLPPLRDRPLDILPLASRLLEKHSNNEKCAVPGLSDEVKNTLLTHTWPGNVRELENVLLRAIVMNRGNIIESINLDKDSINESFEPSKNHIDESYSSGNASLDENLREREHSMIIEVLKAEKGSRKNTAARLRISPRTLRYKLAQIRDAGIQLA